MVADETGMESQEDVKGNFVCHVEELGLDSAVRAPQAFSCFSVTEGDKECSSPSQHGSDFHQVGYVDVVAERTRKREGDDVLHVCGGGGGGGWGLKNP